MDECLDWREYVEVLKRALQDYGVDTEELDENIRIEYGARLPWETEEEGW